jgi:F0F1-type ATP synthase membrane subunit b/b'
MPSITEDADFALLVRLTGFVVILTVAFYFAVKNLMKK